MDILHIIILYITEKMYTCMEELLSHEVSVVSIFSAATEKRTHVYMHNQILQQNSLAHIHMDINKRKCRMENVNLHIALQVISAIYTKKEASYVLTISTSHL